MDSPGIRHIVANVPDYEYMSPIGKPAFQLIGDTSVLVAHPSGPDIRFPLRVPPSPAYIHTPIHPATTATAPLPLLCSAPLSSPPLRICLLHPTSLQPWLLARVWDIACRWLPFHTMVMPLSRPLVSRPFTTHHDIRTIGLGDSVFTLRPTTMATSNQFFPAATPHHA